MNPLTNAVWLYLGSDAKTKQEVQHFTEWCERNDVRLALVHLRLTGAYDDSVVERIRWLTEACGTKGIEVHGMISTLLQRPADRSELPLQDRSCYCTDAHGISNFDDPICGRGYLWDPRHPDVVRTASEGSARLLRQFPGLKGIHLDFVRYYHYDSRLVIDTSSAGHWILIPRTGHTLKLETADGVKTTYFIENVRNAYNDPPIGDKLTLVRSYRYCFCDDCLSGFTRHSGLEIPESLEDTAAKAKWLLEKQPEAWADYRASIITSLVGSIREAIRQVRADAKLSAAVWYNAPYGNELRGEPFRPDSEYELFGQKWWEWAERGDIDFVCPMDYWMAPDSFGSIVNSQTDKLRNRIPLYAGLLRTPEYDIPPGGLDDYISRVRSAGADGLCFFHYGSWKDRL